MKNLRRMKQLLVLVTFALVFVACDENFDEINTDPTVANNIDPRYQFSFIQLRSVHSEHTETRGNFIYTSTFMRQVTVNSFGAHGVIYTQNDDYVSSTFNNVYGEVAKNIQDLLANTADDPAQSNLHNIARIWKVFTYLPITDAYGDIPYSEAGKGVLEGIVEPSYDRQQDIYASMLAELEAAGDALDGSKVSYGSADYVFNGDIAMWKKFANSLMLRMGMRMSKVDPAKAQATVSKAFSRGVITSNSEMPTMKHSESTGENPVAAAVLRYYGNFRISDYFLDMLRDTNDPRASIYFQTPDGSTNPADMVGLPYGVPLNGSGAAGVRNADITSYAQVNASLSDRNNPLPLITPAEVNLMLAEAAQKGWISGNAKSYYDAGVKASMQMWTLVNSGVNSVSDAAVNDYLSANPFDASKAIEQINTQYYIATYLNGYETFANWRRSGYPVLTPTNFAEGLTGGLMPRRLLYPVREQTVNTAKYQEAVANQGADAFTTRVWWDK